MSVKPPEDKARPPVKTAHKPAPNIAREQRLARALRDNLRRRKTGAETAKAEA